jgi:ATP-grasp domain, R2K clade family 2
MPTLILTPRFTDDAQALWRAAGLFGWNVERLSSWRVPEEMCAVNEPVLYLEGLMGPILAAQFGLRLIEPPVDWLPRLPEKYRKRKVELATLGEARLLQQPAFIKPPNDKCFPARVYLGNELSADFPDEMPVLVSEIVEWESEFRCFLLDRELRTFSVYLRNGELQREYGFAHTDQEAKEVRVFVDELMTDSRIDFPKATVLDVGLIRGQGWAAVEQNAAWGSGL